MIPFGVAVTLSNGGGDMNHSSLNTSAIFGICMCCGSSIYGLTVTRASMVIPRAAIESGPSGMFSL